MGLGSMGFHISPITHTLTIFQGIKDTKFLKIESEM